MTVSRSSLSTVAPAVGLGDGVVDAAHLLGGGVPQELPREPDADVVVVEREAHAPVGHARTHRTRHTELAGLLEVGAVADLRDALLVVGDGVRQQVDERLALSVQQCEHRLELGP
jgi:hypothetical protein